MKIYMDNCYFNRPFDVLSQDRVYLEAEAVLSIVSCCEKGQWELLGSGVIEYEMSRLTDADKLETLYASVRTRLSLNDKAETRAADVFLTTDDRLLRAATKLELKIKVANPVSWLMEVTNSDE